MRSIYLVPQGLQIYLTNSLVKRKPQAGKNIQSLAVWRALSEENHSFVARLRKIVLFQPYFHYIMHYVMH